MTKLSMFNAVHQLQWSLLSTMTCKPCDVQVYQEPPLDPEHLITSVATRAEAQLRSKQIADSVLVKAMKVTQACEASVYTQRQASGLRHL